MTSHSRMIPALPAWVEVFDPCGLGVPNVVMLNKPLLRPDGTDPGYPFWAHWHIEPDKKPRWVVGGLPLHDLISRDPWHLEASILCGPGFDGCGLHGFIRGGKWTDA